ncbi:ABC transporter ATP-binding protein [Chromatiales bacterium (ex Bugula neritina AB1)]|nr:ABC transporter ATP-binding protein [Chromatiales bacterium (ex Bugula neritina AB1)]
MSDIAVSLQQLTLAYDNTIAVPQLDLDIHRGELISLLGPSGCGKTTTMRAIAGLMAPRDGKIIIDGDDVTQVPANKREVGLVFQSYALFPHLSGFENVAFGLRLKKTPAAELTQRVEAGLQLVGMGHLADRKPAELSGGQQQRLSLARSLVMKPKVLLLDEPLSNLDARLRLDMRTELQRLQRQTGITMVFVTHDQSEALALSDRIVLMKHGRIEQIGSPEALYNQPQTTFAADFVGYENIFAVAAPSSTHSGSIIHNDHGNLELDYTVAAKHIAWRPGGVIVGKGPHTGTIAAVAFAGNQREYVIDSGAGPVKTEVDASIPAATIGDKINFDLPLSTARIITATS